MLPSRYTATAIMSTVAMETFTRLPRNTLSWIQDVSVSPCLYLRSYGLLTVVAGDSYFFFNYIVTGELAERKKWNRGKGIDRPESMEGEYNHNTLYMFENGERSGGNLVWMAG